MSHGSLRNRFNLLTRLLRRPRMPQLLVIGAQKSGTTALASYLGQHPRLAHPSVKELDFFGSDSRFALGVRWYDSQWHDVRPAATKRALLSALRPPIRFEASPHYMRAPQAARRIRQCIPRVKLIAILRDPVERAYSAWRMYRQQLGQDPAFYDTWNRRCYHEVEIANFQTRTLEELEDFELAVSREVNCLLQRKSMMWSLLEYGFYGPQLRRFAEELPPEQLLVLEHRDLKYRRIETLNRVLGFLECDPWNWEQADLSEVLVSPNCPPMSPRVQSQLREIYAPSNRMLAGLIDPLPDWATDSARPAAA